MTDDQPHQIDDAALDREVDHEIRRRRGLDNNAPAICEESHEIEERCRQRLIAGKSLTDFDLDAFLAETKQATSAAQSQDEAHRIAKALLDRKVPDEEWNDVEAALMHHGFLPADPRFDYGDWYDKSVGTTKPD
ncbi:hypothetical protein [Palleronia sp.]|uniref:hypothetical protein n=1 Tax=Palleronia sp. TaxID=1940284 RepID=UPI0035C7B354